jgi:hypothetical protein
MALLLPFMGPTAHPSRSDYFLPVSQSTAGNNVNAPLVGIARQPVNFQPVLALPTSLPNMSAGYNPRVLPVKVG